MTIFIATDFSEAARNADLYGVHLATAMHANVILFNSYQSYVPAPPSSMEVSAYTVFLTNRQKIEDEAAIISKDSGIDIEAVCEEGNAEFQICSIAKEKKVDYIIVGMSGSSMNSAKIFGNTVTALATHCRIPLLVIPHQAKFSNVATIVFATDTSFGKPSPHLQELLKIVQLFRSKLYVVKVVKSNDDYVFRSFDIPGQFIKDLKVMDTSFQYRINTDIKVALNDFIKSHHADMLVMMPHHHEWVRRLFKTSETKKMIFHTHLPLLIIPDEKRGIDLSPDGIQMPGTTLTGHFN